MSTLYEYYNTGDNVGEQTYGAYWKAQTFTPTIAHKITSVKLMLYRTGSPGTITVSIRATNGSGHPTGSDLCSGTTNGNTLPTVIPWEWREITLGAGYTVVAGTKYAIVMRAIDGNTSNYAVWRGDSSPTYTGGSFEYSANSGSSWTIYAYDMMFENWSVGVPAVTTDSAAMTSETSATLNGTLTNDGGEACDCGFEWGLTPLYGNITPIQSRTTSQTFSQGVSGLLHSTTYHFRAFATNSGGTGYGADRTFATLIPPTPPPPPPPVTQRPVVVTGLASNILRYSVTLNGILTDDGGKPCSVGFEWGEVASNLDSSLVVNSGISPLQFSETLCSFLPGTEYYFRAFATNSAGIGYGSIKSFTTSEALTPIPGLPGTPEGLPVPSPGTLPPLIPGLQVPPMQTVLNFVNIGFVIVGTTGLALIISAEEEKKKKKARL